MEALESDAYDDSAWYDDDRYIYHTMKLYLGAPSKFSLNCNFWDFACSDSYLYAESGSYLYIPSGWNIQCFDDTDSNGAYSSCQPFHLTDGSM